MLVADTPPYQHPKLSAEQRARLLFYAEALLNAQQAMQTNNGNTILHHTLEGQDRHVSMAHYPKGDRIDYDTGAQYFYHCHRENFHSDEHGHFHCFMRYKHIPDSIKPVPLPDWDKFIQKPMTHLVAIGMNRYGQPIRLFSVNRWVTSEIWYSAQDTRKLLELFRFVEPKNNFCGRKHSNNPKHWKCLDTWIEALVQLFSPQITWLQKQRDVAIMRHRDHDVYNDKSVEELSEITIDLTSQIQWVIDSNS